MTMIDRQSLLPYLREYLETTDVILKETKGKFVRY